MRRTLSSALALVTALAGLLGPSPEAAAQLESPLLSRIQPNIVNPGGKSQAMGGAFVAIADDATAAFANPAGLVQLSAFQLGASGKVWGFRPELASSNWYQASASEYGLNSVDRYRITGSATDLEYLSFVAPVTADLAIAAYRAVNLRFRLDASDIEGGYRAFFVKKGFEPNTFGVSLDEEGGVNLRNEVYGVSAGYRLGRLSAGAGLTFSRLAFELGGTGEGPHVFHANAVNAAIRVPGPDAPIDASVEARIEGGTKAGFLVGLRWEIDEAYRVSAGAVYRQNPSWDVDYAIRAVYTTVVSPPVSFSCGVDDPKVPGSGASACGTFKVPDDVAFGLAAMPVPGLVVALELQRVFYSQMSDGFVPVFAYRSGTTRTIPWGEVDDGWVPRAGVEWTLPLKAGDLSVRAGWYREPAHGLVIRLYPDANADRRPDCACAAAISPYSEAFSTTYDGGRADDHVSFGLGTTLARKLSLDLAVDIGSASRVVALSAFYRF